MIGGQPITALYSKPWVRAEAKNLVSNSNVQGSFSYTYSYRVYISESGVTVKTGSSSGTGQLNVDNIIASIKLTESDLDDFIPVGSAKTVSISVSVTVEWADPNGITHKKTLNLSGGVQISRAPDYSFSVVGGVNKNYTYI